MSIITNFFLVLFWVWVICMLGCGLIVLYSKYIHKNDTHSLGAEKVLQLDSTVTEKSFVNASVEQQASLAPHVSETEAAGKSDSGKIIQEEDVSLKINTFEEKIKQEILRQQANVSAAYFLSVCGVLDLDPESETLAKDFIAQIYSGVRLQGQLSETGPNRAPLDPGVRRMLEVLLESSFELLSCADENYQIVKHYKSVLLAKERSLVTRNDYGDVSQAEWIKFSSRFAIDKLKGVAPLKRYMEFYADTWSRAQVVDSGFADMFGGFTRIALAFLQSEIEGGAEKPDLTGTDYEKQLQEEIEAEIPGASVSITAATGDHGADLIVDIDGLRIAIQAKYYQAAVGNSAVQEAFSGKGYYGADAAMVVCNSSYTRHAHQLATKLDVLLATTDTYLEGIRSLRSSFGRSGHGTAQKGG